MRTVISLFCLGICGFLAGCGNYDNVQEKVVARQIEAEKLFEEARAPLPARSMDPLVVSDEIWLGGDSIRMRTGVPLPSEFETDRGFAIVTAQEMTLYELGQELSSQIGVPVRLIDGAVTGLDPTSGFPRNDLRYLKRIQLAYEGPLSGFLDNVSSHFGVFWRYDGSAIVISRYETRVFVMEAMPGQSVAQDGVASNQGGAASSQVAMQFNFWDDLATTLETLIGSDGSFTISQGSGTVTVVATPDRMDSVAAYLESENNRLSQQVLVNIDVYSVQLTDDSQLGLDLANAVLEYVSGSNDLLDATSLAFGGVAPPSLSTGILPGALTGLLSESLGHTFNSADGAAARFTTTGNVVASALESVGNVSQVIQSPLLTLNNRTASRSISGKREYLAEVSATSAGQDAVETSLTPDTIETGIHFQVTPRMLDDGRILMQYSIALTDLIALREASSGTPGLDEQRIQLPETQERVFVQQAMLNSGDTLVLTGFDQERQSANSQGTLGARNWLLGGGETTQRERQVLVVAITPIFVDTKKNKAERM